MLFQVPSSPVAKATGLPLWAQVVNLGITLLLASMRAVEFLRHGKLEVRLTKDSFFRLTDFGEALFVHCVLLARNGPVLIRSVSVTLKRLAGEGTRLAQKSFPLDVMNHGEKVKGKEFTAEHHFYGSSPLLYVAATSTFRPVYHCLQAEYKQRQHSAVLAFQTEIRDFRRRKDGSFGGGNIAPDALQELDQIVKTHHIKMLGLVQLEAGKYELSLKVDYEKCGLMVWKKRENVWSYGYFTVDSDGLERYKGELLDTLSRNAHNIVFGKNEPVRYPEYMPTSFTERATRQS
jgi:hypothetical protein